MFITRVVDVTVLSIGNLNVRFYNNFLEIVDRGVYPNVVYTIPEMRIVELGVMEVLKEKYLAVKTTLPFPHQVQLFPCTEASPIDFPDLKMIFKLLPLGFRNEMDNSPLNIGNRVYFSKQTFSIGKEQYCYDDVLSFKRENKTVVVTIRERAIEVVFELYSDARKFEFYFDRLLRNKVLIDTAYFNLKEELYAVTSFSHDIFYEHGLLSIYDNSTQSCYIENCALKDLEVIAGEPESGLCQLRIHYDDDKIEEIGLTFSFKDSGLTPHKAKLFRMTEEGKIYAKLRGLIWLIKK